MHGVDRQRKAARAAEAEYITFRSAVASDLRAGYGVEDIAVRRGYDLERIREKVKDWRARGFINAILAGQQGGWRRCKK